MEGDHSREHRAAVDTVGLSGATYRAAVLAERHQRMITSAGHLLAHELGRLGCPAPRAEIARRCGVDHWSESSLEEAVLAAEREGLLHRLPLGWLAPAQALGTGVEPRLGQRHRTRSLAGRQRSGGAGAERAQGGGRSGEPLPEGPPRVES
jgi:hypothetical protein